MKSLEIFNTQPVIVLGEMFWLRIPSKEGVDAIDLKAETLPGAMIECEALGHVVGYWMRVGDATVLKVPTINRPQKGS